VRNFVGFLVVGFVLTLGARADAQVLSFDELSPTDIPILGSVVCANGTGFRFHSDHFHLVGGTVTQDFSSNGTSHIGYESGRGFPITMERVGGGTFSLHSLDAGEFYAVPGNERPDAETITIVGHQPGGTMVSHTITLDGIHDGAGGVADYQHFVLPATFVNLTSVVFTGLRAGNLSGGIALDNFQYTLPSPETPAACVAFPLTSDTPVVAITTPTAGNVSGTVIVEATATDNVAVTSVQFRLDGVDLGAPDTTAPYTINWNTTTVPDGPHTLLAEARDGSNNVATSSVVVTVRNDTVVTPSPNYLEFDGADDYVDVPDANGLSFGNGTADTPLTIEAWVRPDAMVRHQLIGKGGDSSTLEYKLHIASGVIRLDVRDRSANAQASAFTTASQMSLIGSWHHLAATYDGRGGATAANGITLYVDGVAVALTRINSAAYVAMENLTGSLQIGREGPMWKQFDGGLDEVRLWNVARSASEIQAMMTTELGGNEPGLVGYWKFNEGSGGTVADDSPANNTATLFNGTAWVPGGPMGPPEPDTTAPAITNIATSNPTHSGITISFNTNEVATGWVSYSTTPACPCTDVYSAGTGTTHVVNLSGLSATTTYYFVVKASDASSNLTTGPSMSFTTPVIPPDTILPAVAMIRPSGNVVGTVVVEASATDNVGVTSVQLRVDGVNLGGPIVAPPYSVSWDTTALPDGLHTLSAEARDAANNVGTASVVVNVRNNVTVSAHYLDFDGVNDYLQAADASDLSFVNGAADTPLTIESWIRPDAMVRHQLIGKGMDGTLEYKVHIANGVIRLDLRDASANAMASAFTANSQLALVGGWHHLAVTYDGRGGATAANGIAIYIDGVSVALVRFNNAAYVAMENLSGALQIGREGPNWKQYDGGLDELRMWNVARTASEIQASMATELGGAEAGLVAYWKFNEGIDATAADDSPADHTATLINNPGWVTGGPIP
jgi:hypothetical protein